MTIDLFSIYVSFTAVANHIVKILNEVFYIVKHLEEQGKKENKCCTVHCFSILHTSWFIYLAVSFVPNFKTQAIFAKATWYPTYMLDKPTCTVIQSLNVRSVSMLSRMFVRVCNIILLYCTNVIQGQCLLLWSSSLLSNDCWCYLILYKYIKL